MNQISSKIYYLTSTGEVLIITSEMQGSIKETTKEYDMGIYIQLRSYNVDEVDFIKLEYGTLATTLNNAKEYKINLETKKIEVIYYTQEELNLMKQQAEKSNELNSRASDISAYLFQNENVTSDVEDLILQSEQNKIINGGI